MHLKTEMRFEDNKEVQDEIWKQSDQKLKNWKIQGGPKQLISHGAC